MENCKHQKPYYTVKRLRLLQYLKERGHMESATIPDPTNPKYNWWLFDNTPELEMDIEAYFNNI